MNVLFHIAAYYENLTEESRPRLSNINHSIVSLASSSFDPFATGSQRGKLVLIKLQVEFMRGQAIMDEKVFKKRVLTPLINCLKSPDNPGTEAMIYEELLADMKSVKLSQGFDFRLYLRCLSLLNIKIHGLDFVSKVQELLCF